MKKLKQKSELERLQWLIRTVRKYTRPHIEVSGSTDALLFFAATSLVRISFRTAQGSISLLEAKNTEAAAMLERNIYEFWCELRYLFDHKNKASQIYLNSIQEFIDTHKESQSLNKSKEVKFMKSFYEVLKKKFPFQFNEVKNQRKKYKFHWSGLSRTKLVKNVAADGNKLIYQVLSWETHAVMNAIRDIYGMDTKKGNINFGEYINPVMNKEEIAYRTAGYCLYIWNEYAENFEFTIIDPNDYKDLSK